MRRSEGHLSSQTTLTGTTSLTVEAAMQPIIVVAGRSGYVPQQFGDMLLLTRTTEKTPWWAIVLAIVLFPIGLPFLLAKKKETNQITATFSRGTGGCGYSISPVMPGGELTALVAGFPPAQPAIPASQDDYPGREDQHEQGSPELPPMPG